MRLFRRRDKEPDEALEWVNAFRVNEGFRPLKEWPENEFLGHSWRSTSCPVARALGPGWSVNYVVAHKFGTFITLPRVVRDKIAYFDRNL